MVVKPPETSSRGKGEDSWKHKTNVEGYKKKG